MGKNYKNSFASDFPAQRSRWFDDAAARMAILNSNLLECCSGHALNIIFPESCFLDNGLVTAIEDLESSH